MVLTLVLVLIGVLLFLVIAYNIMQQYRAKIEAEKQATISKQKAIIDETDELLLNASRMPYSKELLLILHNRILTALNAVVQVDSGHKQVKQRIKDLKQQLEQLKENYNAPDDAKYRAPESDKHALLMLQIVKKIRAVLRSEQSKGKVDTQVYVAEDRRLELMQLKINLENAIKRAKDARLNRQFGTAKQLLSKGIQTLKAIPDKDAYLQAKVAEMEGIKSEIDEQLKSASQKDLEDRQQQEIDELDVLFQPKKKW